MICKPKVKLTWWLKSNAALGVSLTSFSFSTSDSDSKTKCKNSYLQNVPLGKEGSLGFGSGGDVTCSIGLVHLLEDAVINAQGGSPARALLWWYHHCFGDVWFCCPFPGLLGLPVLAQSRSEAAWGPERSVGIAQPDLLLSHPCLRCCQAE